MKTFELEIVTLDGSPFSGQAERVLVRTTEGDVEILAGHTDCLAVIDAGRLKIVADGTTTEGVVSGGFISVEKGSVKLVATTFERADEIDVNRARLAKEKAENKLRNSTDDKELKLAKAKLLRALARISVGQKK